MEDITAAVGASDSFPDSSSGVPTSMNLFDLHDDMLEEILCAMEPDEVVHVCRVNRRLRAVATSSRVWERFSVKVNCSSFEDYCARRQAEIKRKDFDRELLRLHAMDMIIADLYEAFLVLLSLCWRWC